VFVRRLGHIREVLKEGYCEVFFVRQNARPAAREMAYLAGQRDFALCIEGVSNVQPAVGDCLAADLA
jgi:hypothetical protein